MADFLQAVIYWIDPNGFDTGIFEGFVHPVNRLWGSDIIIGHIETEYGAFVLIKIDLALGHFSK